ncbi:MAG: hypothetical protein ACI97N_001139 [Cognaticolwellia sp.]|jgi:hypothetical protein
MKKLLFLLPIIFLFSNCRETTEGCLNPEASNFDPSADETCCCEYPQFSVRFSYNNYSTDTTAFALNSVYNDDGSNPYYINNISLYISDFELIKADNSILKTTDSLEVILQNGTLTEVIDDIIILKSNLFKYDIGTTTTSGNFIKLRFKVGLNDLINQTNPEEVETTHPLSDANDLYETDGYIFNKIDIITDTSATDIMTNFEIKTPYVQIELNHNFSIYSGFDTEVKINADLKKLLETVNFQTDDVNTIQSKIVTNAVGIFTIVE